MNTSSPHDRRQPGQSRWRRLLHEYRFELIWGAVVALGLFLVLERLSIRRALRGWLERLILAGRGGLDRLDAAILRFFATTTLSDILGLVLIIGALVAIVLRIRWRLTHDPRLAVLRCPKCGGEIHRVHRHRVDRLINVFIQVRRYRCGNRTCGWGGLRIGKGHHAGRTAHASKQERAQS